MARYVQFAPGLFAREGETLTDARGEFIFEDGSWRRTKGDGPLPAELMNRDLPPELFKRARRGSNLPESPQ